MLKSKTLYILLNFARYITKKIDEKDSFCSLFKALYGSVFGQLNIPVNSFLRDLLIFSLSYRSYPSLNPESTLFCLFLILAYLVKSVNEILIEHIFNLLGLGRTGLGTIRRSYKNRDNCGVIKKIREIKGH